MKRSFKTVDAKKVERIAKYIAGLAQLREGPVGLDELLIKPPIENDATAAFLAIKKLVREYEVATYYRPPPSGTSKHEFFREGPALEKRTYPSLKFFKLILLDKIQLAYVKDPNSFGSMEEFDELIDPVGSASIYFIDEENYCVPLVVAFAIEDIDVPTILSYTGPVRVYFKYTAGLSLSYYEPYKKEAIELAARNYVAVIKALK